MKMFVCVFMKMYMFRNGINIEICSRERERERDGHSICCLKFRAPRWYTPFLAVYTSYRHCLSFCLSIKFCEILSCVAVLYEGGFSRLAMMHHIIVCRFWSLFKGCASWCSGLTVSFESYNISLQMLGSLTWVFLYVPVGKNSLQSVNYFRP